MAAAFSLGFESSYISIFLVILMVTAGDSEVMLQCRKLELALMPNGWRGNVEEDLTREMFGAPPDILAIEHGESNNEELS